MVGTSLTTGLKGIVGRIYAGVLGPLAVVVVVIRGLRRGAATETTMLAGALCLLGFAALGYIVGRIADGIVDDSAQTKVEFELAVREADTKVDRTSTAVSPGTGGSVG